jgi:hypothetical protein
MERTGRSYAVKVYTEWGWAGFREGTPGQIANDLAGTRAEAAAVADTLRYSGCDLRLDPFTGPTQCPCGTVVWHPRAWTTSFETIRDVLAYLSDAPDPETVLDAAMVNAFWYGTHEQWETFDDFGAVAQALSSIVPTGTWVVLHGRLIGVIPTCASFVPGAAGEVLAGVAALGYTLEVRAERHSDESKLAGWFVLDELSEELPAWFTISPHADAWHVVVGSLHAWRPAGFADQDDPARGRSPGDSRGSGCRSMVGIAPRPRRSLVVPPGPPLA